MWIHTSSLKSLHGVYSYCIYFSTVIASTILKVRYAETDRMGVAYYASYFVWFEVGRTSFFDALGLPYRELEDRWECILPVVEAYCNYRNSVNFDDELKIETWITRVKRRGLTFNYRILRNGVLVAEGYTRHINVDKRGKPKDFPGEVYNRLKKAENEDNRV